MLLRRGKGVEKVLLQMAPCFKHGVEEVLKRCCIKLVLVVNIIEHGVHLYVLCLTYFFLSE